MDCHFFSSADDSAAPVQYLQEEILALKGLEFDIMPAEPVQTEPEPVAVEQPPVVPERKPAEKKMVKPKWLKM